MMHAYNLVSYLGFHVSPIVVTLTDDYTIKIVKGVYKTTMYPC